MAKYSTLKAQLAQAKSSLGTLEALLAREEALSTATKANFTKAKESQVLEKLAALPIEKLREISDSSIRIETLRKYGLTTVASVYLATISQLERLSGITQSSAEEMKELAEELFDAASEAANFKFNVDSPSQEDLTLLENLKSLEAVRSPLRGNRENISPVVNELQKHMSATAPLSSRFRWLFAGSNSRASALREIESLNTLLSIASTAELVQKAATALNTQQSKNTSTTLEDFRVRSTDYYATLEDVAGPARKLGDNHLTAELIAKIEGQALEQSAIKATLRRYQIFGSKFALSQNRVILGDEMGLGKTMQALGVLAHRKSEGANRFLVVCPASVLVNWQREIESRTDLPFSKIHGSEQKSGFKEWVERGGIALTTFDTLKAIELSIAEISSLNVDTVVVDEAHYVKNLETGRAKAISTWLDSAPNVLFMTGTPLENKVAEFVNLTSLLDKKFAEELNKGALAAGPESFRQHVAPIYLRRNSSEVLTELPDLIEIEENCTWDGADLDSYLQAVATGNFMGMRKAGMTPGEFGVLPNKVERLKELVAESLESNRKVIVFSYFRDVLNLVTQTLGDVAIGPITGSVSSIERQRLVDQFTESKEPKVLVGQIQAAGTGLNIQAASVIILCEPQIKPSLEVQAIARAHRMGQVRSVQVHRLIIPLGVDQRLQQILYYKQQEFDEYARVSELANNSSSAKDHSEEMIIGSVVRAERERLALDTAAPLTPANSE